MASLRKYAPSDFRNFHLRAFFSLLNGEYTNAISFFFEFSINMLVALLQHNAIPPPPSPLGLITAGYSKWLSEKDNEQPPAKERKLSWPVPTVQFQCSTFHSHVFLIDHSMHYYSSQQPPTQRWYLHLSSSLANLLQRKEHLSTKIEGDDYSELCLKI